MGHATRAVLFAGILAFALVGQALTAERVALVIGNGDYRHVAQLPNPTNDAQDMAELLSRLGFTVRHASDLNRVAMLEALADFSDTVLDAEIALVFFAGHGLELNRENYLIPIDARLEVDRRVRFEGVALADVEAALDAAKGIRVILLDACRNNPFAASMQMSSATRSVPRGLTRVEATAGSLISFAAKEGTVADDGDGRNSPFTAALLANLAEPGVEIGLLFRRVRDSVLEATGGRQEPYVSTSLPSEPIYFLPPVDGEPRTEADGEVATLQQRLAALEEQLANAGRNDRPQVQEPAERPVVSQESPVADWQPTRRIELVVPYGPGGNLDIFARTVAQVANDQRLSPQPISVVNQPGGAWRPYVDGKAGDDHVVMMASNDLTSGQGRADYAPIAMFGTLVSSSGKEYPLQIASSVTMSPSARAYYTGLMHDIAATPAWRQYRQRVGLVGDFLSGTALETVWERAAAN